MVNGFDEQYFKGFNVDSKDIQDMINACNKLVSAIVTMKNVSDSLRDSLHNALNDLSDTYYEIPEDTLDDADAYTLMDLYDEATYRYEHAIDVLFNGVTYVRFKVEEFLTDVADALNVDENELGITDL